MTDIKSELRELVSDALKSVANDRGLDAAPVAAKNIVVELPKRREHGDLAFPMFPFAGVFKMGPQQIAADVCAVLQPEMARRNLGTAESVGPYVNVRLDRAGVSQLVLSAVDSDAAEYGSRVNAAATRVMVEFSCPNTNKPLHLGHLRNDAIGESVARILKFAGRDVMKVNLINDRGVHICQSMLAYQEHGNGTTPEQEGRKSDHFVGDYYVKYSEMATQDESAGERARRLLRAWEQGDLEVRTLWEKMNRWAIEGIQATYDRTGISFDKVYFESQTYDEGKAEILRGLEEGVFYREEDSSVWVDLQDIDLDRKLLLRSDGTSVYMTQDIGTAIRRHRDWPFERMVYVVAAEQEYHFKVLFEVLRRLGHRWADSLYHLSYGMVNLPEGRMKSREGTVVDADDLLDELAVLAGQEIRNKDRESEIADMERTSEDIAQAAVNYYLLNVSPAKDMVFDPAESISFNGNSGPYLQYTGARISSMLRKYEERKDQFAAGRLDTTLISDGDEWDLIKLLSAFPETVQLAARDLNPGILTTYLFDVAKTFSRYYHDHPVLHNENPDLVVTRICLARAVVTVLRNGMKLICVPFLERM